MTGALIPVLSVFAVVAAGVLAGRTRVLPEGALDVLNRFAFLFAFPALAFTALWRAPPDLLLDWRLYAAQLPAMAVAVALALGLAAVFGAPAAARAGAAFSVASGNAAYLGFPLVILAVGPDALPLAAAIAGLYLLVGLPFGTALTARAAHREGSVSAGRIAGNLARIPLIWAVVLGVPGSLLRVELGLPRDLPPLDILAGAASATALFALGLFMANVRGRDLGARPGALASVVVAKLAVFPVLVWGMTRVLGMAPGDVVTVSVLQAAVPAGVTVFTVTRELRGDAAFAAASVVVTTLIAVVTLPVVLGLIGAG